MIRRMICPFHQERSASCVVYADHYRCYGCGATGPLSELGLEGTPVEAPEPEDLAAAFEYIEKLPRKLVRGLLLPKDDHSYFIPWPGRDYYKRRWLRPGKGGKYTGARGHKKPPFWARAEGANVLVIVEGELNALTIAKCCPELDVMSPGGAGDFASRQMRTALSSILYYSIILVLADRDAPGAEACISLIAEFAARGKQVKAHLMEVDANDLLQTRGCAEVRSQVFNRLGPDVEASAG